MTVVGRFMCRLHALRRLLARPTWGWVGRPGLCASCVVRCTDSLLDGLDAWVHFWFGELTRLDEPLDPSGVVLSWVIKPTQFRRTGSFVMCVPCTCPKLSSNGLGASLAELTWLGRAGLFSEFVEIWTTCSLQSTTTKTSGTSLFERKYAVNLVHTPFISEKLTVEIGP